MPLPGVSTLRNFGGALISAVFALLSVTVRQSQEFFACIRFLSLGLGQRCQSFILLLAPAGCRVALRVALSGRHVGGRCLSPRQSLVGLDGPYHD